MSYKRKKQKEAHDRYNRLNFIMTIVFLLAGLLVFQLIKIQIFQYDLYAALAQDQHQVYNQLLPERGDILIQDKSNEGEELYPLATNKDFALVYAIPDKIENPQKTAEVLFDIFDKENLEKEVDELLEEDEYFKEEIEENISEAGKKSKAEFKAIKRELEIEARQKDIISNYFSILAKKFDPYEPLRSKVDEEKLKTLMDLDIEGIDYIMEKHRYYPEKNIGSHLTGFVGFSGDKKAGRYGLEGFFNDELAGSIGVVKTERAADGGLTIINDRKYLKELDGSDLILSINRSIQYTVCQKVQEAAEKYAADSGTVIVMEPMSGAILAMCSWPNYDANNYYEVEDINIYNNPAIFTQYEPGSIFKVFTLAAGIDKNVITPDSTYFDKGYVKIEGWPEPIKNSDFETHGGHGLVNMVTVLEQSLNTGTIHVMEKVGAKAFAQYVKDFGFGEKTGIELETEGLTNIINLKRKNIRPVEAATASFGQGITVTPLQIITAYSALVNGGILMKPYIVSEIILPDGTRQKTQSRAIKRVISEKTSLLLSGMMVNVVQGGHAKLASVEGYYVGGKTGTAQVADKEKGGYQEDNTIHTFVGFAPADEPKFVMLTKLDHPKNVDFAASSAAPLFGEIAKFILNYLQIPKDF